MSDPYYADGSVTLHLGDSLDILPTLEDASVDAVVCDPPYGLAELATATVMQAIAAWMGGDRTHVPNGRGFMGRDWDRFVPPPGVWDECLRVLKPGGHLAAFAGSRTVDLMTLSIRIAGFEIRDGLQWIYGSGFPKSLDVSKAIDKSKRRDYVLAAVELGLTIPGNNLHDWTKAEHSPGDAWWEKFKAHLSAGDWQRIQRAVIGQRTTGLGTGRGDVAYIGDSSNRDVTAPATEDAARWQGWGTALKPAHEPIVLARKPLAGTVAATVLAHGTGALNIDGCRTPAGQDHRDKCASVVGIASPRNGDTGGERTGAREDSAHAAGRWPTNVLLTHQPLIDADGQVIGDACADGCVPGCPVADMDRQTLGTRASKPSKSGSAGTQRDAIYGGGKGMPRDYVPISRDDAGGASRFFPVFRYEAKAPASERPRLADGTAHPTVKPLALMQWLVRLVTPPGGLVLDPFAGSGTTLEAAVIEGFRSIGIEREKPHADLCITRLAKPIALDLFGGGAA